MKTAEQHSTEADREVARSVSGLYWALLTDDEKESVDRCIKDGVASREWNILGLSKITVP